MAKSVKGGIPPKHTREDVLKRMAEKYPDRSFDADDDLYDSVYGALDEYESGNKELEENNKRYKENEDKFVQMFENNPDAAGFIVDLSEGKDPLMSLIRIMGIDGVRDALDDPGKAKELEASHKTYLENMKKDALRKQEWQANVNVSFDAEDEAVERGELSEDDLERAHESLSRKVENYIMGKWTVEDLKNELKSLNYDADLMQASEEAEIRGRNANIVEKKRMRRQGDGMPQVGGGGKTPMRQPHRADTSKLGALGRERKSMWE